MKKRSPLIRWGACAAFSLAVTAGVLASRDYFGLESAAARYSALSDGFFAPAVMLLGLSGLLFVASDGVFDTFGFAFSKFRQLIRGREEGEPRTYYDYKILKHGVRKSPGKQFIVLGAADLLLAVIFYLLFSAA